MRYRDCECDGRRKVYKRVHEVDYQLVGEVARYVFAQHRDFKGNELLLIAVAPLSLSSSNMNDIILFHSR